MNPYIPLDFGRDYAPILSEYDFLYSPVENAANEAAEEARFEFGAEPLEPARG